MNFNFKNITENIIYFLAGAIISAFVTFSATYLSNKTATKLILNAFMPAVEESFRKETNKIETSFKTEIKKLKVKKGVSTIDYVPDVENVIQQQIDTTTTEKPKEKKKGFFNRLFKK